ncbi:MAG: MFS transporter [Spirochaetaceae bacterium]|nr:MAG: MFS transporter [Spirochaetaceae bacterium]
MAVSRWIAYTVRRTGLCTGRNTWAATVSKRPSPEAGPVSTILPYLGFSFFQDLALVYPVYMIYFQQQGLDYLRMSWLLAIWGVPVLLMELPSGVIADLWSRKWSLVIGMGLKAAGFGVWLVRPDFVGFALGFVLWGLQEGICTGVGEALLYDSLRASGEESRFVQISGRGGMLRRLAIVLSVLLGGALFTLSASVVMIASSAAMVIAALCAALIPEEAPGKRGRAGHAEISGGIAAIRHSLGSALRGEAFVPLMIFGALATVVYGVLDEYDFLFGREQGVSLALIGLWGGFRFLMEGIGALLAHRLENRLRLDSPKRLALWMAGAGLLLVPVILTGSVFLLPLYFLFFFMMAVAELLFQGWIQRRIKSAGRATVSSLVSLVYEAFGLLLVLAAGPVSQQHGLAGLFLAGGILSSAAGILFGLAYVAGHRKPGVYRH